MFAHRDFTIFDSRGQQNAPAVFRHLHIVEFRPAFRVDRDSGAQVNHRVLKVLRDQVIPPVYVTRVPFFQRLQHLFVLAQVYIIRDLGVVAYVD